MNRREAIELMPMQWNKDKAKVQGLKADPTDDIEVRQGQGRNGSGLPVLLNVVCGEAITRQEDPERVQKAHCVSLAASAASRSNRYRIRYTTSDLV
jgi:hypothetical protein